MTSNLCDHAPGSKHASCTLEKLLCELIGTEHSYQFEAKISDNEIVERCSKCGGINIKRIGTPTSTSVQ